MFSFIVLAHDPEHLVKNMSGFTILMQIYFRYSSEQSVLLGKKFICRPNELEISVNCGNGLSEGCRDKWQVFYNFSWKY